MPNYDVKNKVTGEISEKFMTISKMEEFIKENTDYEIVFLGMNLGDPVLLGVKQPPSDFLKYVIDPIHRRNGSRNGPKKESRFRAPREI